MQRSIVSLFKSLWIHFSGLRRVQFCALFIVMLIAPLAEVVSIGMLVPFLSLLTDPERIIRYPIMQFFVELCNVSNAREFLFYCFLVFIIAVFISGVVRLMLFWLQNRFSYAVAADFSNNIFKRTIYQPYTVHIDRNSSQVIAGISNKTKSLAPAFFTPVMSMMSSILMLICIIGALFFVTPMVTMIIILIFGLIYGMIILLNKKKLINNSYVVSQTMNQVIKILQEGLGGIRDVLINGTQETFCEIYRNIDSKLRQAQVNIIFIGTSPRYVIETFGIILIASFAFLLSDKSTSGFGPIPILGALALGAQRLLPSLQLIYSSWSSIKGSSGILADIIDMLDQPMPSIAQKLIDPIVFQSHITLSQVSFRYKPYDKLILNGIDFVIPKGSKIGIIGVTGSGKSTLLDIIMGLLEPSQGKLKIDNIPLDMHNYCAWDTARSNRL